MQARDQERGGPVVAAVGGEHDRLVLVAARSDPVERGRRPGRVAASLPGGRVEQVRVQVFALEARRAEQLARRKLQEVRLAAAGRQHRPVAPGSAVVLRAQQDVSLVSGLARGIVPGVAAEADHGATGELHDAAAVALPAVARRTGRQLAVRPGPSAVFAARHAGLARGERAARRIGVIDQRGVARQEGAGAGHPEPEHRRIASRQRDLGQEAPRAALVGGAMDAAVAAGVDQAAVGMAADDRSLAAGTGEVSVLGRHAPVGHHLEVLDVVAALVAVVGAHAHHAVVQVAAGVHPVAPQVGVHQRRFLEAFRGPAHHADRRPAAPLVHAGAVDGGRIRAQRRAAVEGGHDRAVRGHRGGGAHAGTGQHRARLLADGVPAQAEDVHVLGPGYRGALRGSAYQSAGAVREVRHAVAQHQAAVVKLRELGVQRRESVRNVPGGAAVLGRGKRDVSGSASDGGDQPAGAELQRVERPASCRKLGRGLPRRAAVGRAQDASRQAEQQRAVAQCGQARAQRVGRVHVQSGEHLPRSRGVVGAQYNHGSAALDCREERPVPAGGQCKHHSARRLGRCQVGNL